MDLEPLYPQEFAAETVYLNSAVMGLPPRRALVAMEATVREWAAGRTHAPDFDRQVNRARGAFARLAGFGEEDVAVGATAAPLVGAVAAALPQGAEVLVAAGEFTSVTGPFQHRAGLRVRQVPLEALAETVAADTALVAVSAVQSADGRVADLAAIREATRTHGARLLVDATQALGWMDLRATGADYVVAAAYKWLLAPRGVAFLGIAPDAAAGLRPLAPGWYAGEDPWANCYDRIELASSARRFDSSPVWLSFAGAVESLALIEEAGPERIGAHNLALAGHFRDGLRAIGLRPLDQPRSAIVSVPGLGDAAKALEAAGIRASVRAGNLRTGFHLYNGPRDTDAALAVLRGLV